MKYKNAVIITGPTTVGKTQVCNEVAKRLDAEIINSDRLYVYSFLPIGSGLFGVLNSSDVTRHLYGICQPHEIITTEEYVKLVENLVPQILGRDKLPLIESCSSTYNPALIECNKQSKRDFYYSPVIGLRLPVGTNVRSRIEARLDNMFAGGVLQEAEYIHTAGWKDLHPVEISIVHNPLMKYFDGKFTLEEAKQEIIRTGLHVAQMQRERFEKIHEVVWIEHNPDKSDATIENIIELIHHHTH